MSAAPRARWGWHQLTDDWAQRLVEDAAIHPRDLVLDVGAGHGAITARLLDAGARVIAVELHPHRADVLRSRFAGSDIVVVRADASDLRLPRRPFHVVANPPFSIITALLKRLVQPGNQLSTATLIVPRHVALRWSDQSRRAHARWSRAFVCHYGGDVPRTAFRPAPPGQTALLKIDRR